MNVTKNNQKSNEDLNKAIEKGLQEWLERELPHMIDEEMQSLQADHDEVTVDEESLKQTKKEIGDIIKSLFQ